MRRISKLDSNVPLRILENMSKSKPVSQTPKTGRRLGRTYGAIKELDPRQRKLISLYLDPESPAFMNKSIAGKMAGYTYQKPSAPLEPAHMAKNVRRALEEAMDKAGMTPEILAQRHKALLMKQEHRFNPKTGAFEETNLPETNAVKSALDMAYKVRGDYAPEKVIAGFADINSILESIQNNEQPIIGTEGETGR